MNASDLLKNNLLQKQKILEEIELKRKENEQMRKKLEEDKKINLPIILEEYLEKRFYHNIMEEHGVKNFIKNLRNGATETEWTLCYLPLTTMCSEIYPKCKFNVTEEEAYHILQSLNWTKKFIYDTHFLFGWNVCLNFEKSVKRETDFCDGNILKTYYDIKVYLKYNNV